MMIHEPPTPENIARSAAHYVHSVAANMQATIYPMTLESYRASVFLDGRIVLPDPEASATINFMELCGLFPNVASAHTRYLFHISHVGSTLVSRQLGCKQNLLSLREPVLLRWLSQYKALLGRPESRIDVPTYHAFLAATLGLIGRPLGGVDQVVVKPTSFTCNLAHDILTAQPKARAIGVYARLDAFVATILKGGAGWNDIVELCSIRLKRLHDLLGAEPWQLSQMSPGEIAAMSWLAEMAALQQGAKAAGERFAWLDFDTYLRTPEPSFAMICDTLRVEWGEADAAAVAASGIGQRYSKDSSIAFGMQTRQSLIAEVMAQRSSEISRARFWLDSAIAAHSEFEALAALS